jgi:hypothetical protein
VMDTIIHFPARERWVRFTAGFFGLIMGVGASARIDGANVAASRKRLPPPGNLRCHPRPGLGRAIGANESGPA